MRAALNREAGEIPALSRSCHAELPPIRHWATGKAGRSDEAEPEELPHRNAASSLRATGRRDESSDSYAFLRCLQKGFLFVQNTERMRRNACKYGDEP